MIHCFEYLVITFIIYCHYHLDTFSKYFGKSSNNGELYTRHRRLLYRKDTPYKYSNTSESCPRSFQMNIRKLRPLQGTTSIPDLKTDENADGGEN